MTAVTALVLVALAGGCVTENSDVGPWRDAASVGGLLATEIGPALPSRPEPATLRVASWNLHFGEDTVGIASAIAGSPALAAADVILVQEIEAYPDEPGTRASRIASALGMTWVYAPSRVEGAGTHGIAILSKYTIVSAQVRDLPRFNMPVGEEPRIALASTFEFGARVVDVHLDVRLGIADRIRQLDPAVPYADEVALVVGGDFNSAPWSWVDGAVPLLGSEAIVGQETPAQLDSYMEGTGYTSGIDPGVQTLHALPIRCDDLYATGYAITGGSVEHVDGSDHWPIWIDIDLAGATSSAASP